MSPGSGRAEGISPTGLACDCIGADGISADPRHKRTS
jgi:hypothetical protein